MVVVVVFSKCSLVGLCVNGCALSAGAGSAWFLMFFVYDVM